MVKKIAGLLFVYVYTGKHLIQASIRMNTHAFLSVVHMFDGSVLLDLYVESVGLVVLGHHLARLDDSALFGQVLFAETLVSIVSNRFC